MLYILGVCVCICIGLMYIFPVNHLQFMFFPTDVWTKLQKICCFFTSHVWKVKNNMNKRSSIGSVESHISGIFVSPRSVILFITLLFLQRFASWPRGWGVWMMQENDDDLSGWKFVQEKNVIFTGWAPFLRVTCKSSLLPDSCRINCNATKDQQMETSPHLCAGGGVSVRSKDKLHETGPGCQ